MNFHKIIGKGVDEIDMTVTDETTYLDVFNTINKEFDEAYEGKFSRFFPVFDKREIGKFRYENINWIKRKIDFVMNKYEGDQVKRVHLLDPVEKYGILEIKKDSGGIGKLHGT